MLKNKKADNMKREQNQKMQLFSLVFAISMSNSEAISPYDGHGDSLDSIHNYNILYPL